MKLYKTSYLDSTGVLRTKWSGAQAAASGDRAAVKREGAKDVKTDTVDMTPSKSGILALLNSI